MMASMQLIVAVATPVQSVFQCAECQDSKTLKTLAHNSHNQDLIHEVKNIDSYWVLIIYRPKEGVARLKCVRGMLINKNLALKEW